MSKMDSSSSARKNRNAEGRGASSGLVKPVVKDAKYWELKYIKLFNKRKAILAEIKQNKLKRNELAAKMERQRQTIELINAHIKNTRDNENTELEKNQLDNASGKSLKAESSSKQVSKNTKIVCSECYTKSGFKKLITRTHSHVLVNQ